MKNKDDYGVSMDCTTQWVADMLNNTSNSNLKSEIKTVASWKEGCRNADSYVYYCSKCRRTWESIPIAYKERRTYHAYTHVTGYGKKKKVCIDCS